MSSLRNAVKRKTHKERAQPLNRRHLGLLEKKKDYLLRAKDYHRKQDRLRNLREKAAMRNPDEFYKRMVHSSTKEGVATLNRAATEYTPAEIALLRSQDTSYVQTKLQAELKKVERLRGSLQLYEFHKKPDPEAHSDTESEEEHERVTYTYFNRFGVELRSKRKHVKRGLVAPVAPPTDRKHTVFVDDAEAVGSFSTAEYFNTPQQLVTRRYNRVTTDELAKGPVYQAARQASTLHRSAATSTTSSSSSSSTYADMQRAKALEQVQEWDFDSDDAKEIDRALGLPVANESDNDESGDDEDGSDDAGLSADIAALLNSSQETRAKLPIHIRKQLERAERARTQQYSELETREARVKSLKRILAEMQLKTQLMGKGTVSKIKKGNKVIYKWKPERKK